MSTRAALRYTLEHGVATFWSTSRNELWVKGATSGDTLQIVEVRVNCEQNSLLYLVRPLGKGACHTKDAAGNTRECCYYRRIAGDHLERTENLPQRRGERRVRYQERLFSLLGSSCGSVVSMLILRMDSMTADF